MVVCVCATAFIPTGVQLEEFKTRHLSFVISSTLLYGDEDMFTFLFFYLFISVVVLSEFGRFRNKK
jgi:hypothetical protein